MNGNILGIDIARRVDAPTRWIEPIAAYLIVGGKAYIQAADGSCHFDDIHDLVSFDPADNVGTLGAHYYKLPVEKVEYLYKEDNA